MERGFKSAEQSAAAFERELSKLERQQAKVDAAMQQVGRGMLAGGAAILAGLGLAVKAAIDWESAWTGVAKVVSGSPAQMAALEEQLRGLARVLPATHEEIAAVAAAAGQLGVRRQDIVGFTRVMLDLGVATNLTSQDAAFALARLMNIMQTAPKDVGRLGAAITQLGNTSATTEAEIVQMALRIAGAGHTVGMSEADVLGFAAALSSVGIEAEAGGSAISRAFIRIETAVRGGGEQLDTFARVAGVSADQFRTAYEQDAARAVASFVKGLGRIQASGGDVFATLETLGLSEIRTRDAMLRLAGAGDLLSRSLGESGQGWREQTALIQEAQRRYDTVAGKMGVARNAITDLGIEIGDVLLPAVANATRFGSGLLQFLGDLPGPVKTVLTLFALLTGALLTAGGAALLVVPRIGAAKASLDMLANSTSRLARVTVAATGMLGRIGNILTGPWGIAIGVAITALAAFGVAQANARAEVKEMADLLDEQTGAVTLNYKAKVLAKLEEKGFAEQAQRSGVSMNTLVEAALGNARAMAEVEKATAAARAEQDALAGENVFVRVDDLSHALDGERDLLGKARAEWQRRKQLLDANTESTQKLDPATQRLADKFKLTSEEAKDLNEELDTMDKEIQAAFDSIFGLSNAQDDLRDATDRLKDAVKRQREENVKGAGSFQGMSKAARENRDNLQDVLEAQAALTLQTIRQTGSQAEAEAATNNFKTEMGKLAKQLGINIGDVGGYNDAVAEIERQVKTKFTFDNRVALDDISDVRYALNHLPRRIRVQVFFTSDGDLHVTGGTILRQHGGIVDGPSGPDRVPARLTAGEFVNTRDATMRNRAALEAANAGARLAVVGSQAGRGGGLGDGDNITVNLTAYSDQFSIKQVMDDLSWHNAH